MSSDGKTKGSCACGAVKFETDEPITGFTACHCKTCRQWTGGPFMATNCGENVRFEGEENIGKINFSEWAERGFCKVCGSSLYYKLISSGQYFMSLGSFEDQNGLVMKTQVFIDEKPDSYEFANECKVMTGEEVFAQFAPKQ